MDRMIPYENVSRTNGARPVISLNNSIEISGGDGTVTTPYIIE